MKDYRVTVKVRNNRILKAIEDSGGVPGAKWCKANGMSYQMVNDLINMTLSPLAESGGISITAGRLCEVLGKLPEDLWSNEQLYPLERNYSEMEMDYAHIVAMLPSEQQFYLPDFSGIEQSEIRCLVSKALSKLCPRERDVIRMRFEEDLTLEECAKRLDVTRERVRQIELKAFRKLRMNPAAKDMLISALDMIIDG